MLLASHPARKRKGMAGGRSSLSAIGSIHRIHPVRQRCIDIYINCKIKSQYFPRLPYGDCSSVHTFTLGPTMGHPVTPVPEPRRPNPGCGLGMDSALTPFAPLPSGPWSSLHSRPSALLAQCPLSSSLREKNLVAMSLTRPLLSLPLRTPRRPPLPPSPPPHEPPPSAKPLCTRHLAVHQACWPDEA